ncbi:MAG: bifunctional (p)ppGpp synthetase/guanosine-3',5'-bis(diphosphate) 3'-pyrophosphohydrolase [Actinomycetota bacterium]|nr:bifunctional (p)ppGpp synthetase/guanosine-3',5'-bis(diphosphate) 3'-pyrophosphohydrolase [Actinomycetota bacterium]MDD5665978.1 bifunctional (p)ppGpp synthetase/guanosine-3',5'-bis(diphosphate) 3'-pyrophosphohydrolase [Actinomycetota bacterium]
MSQSIDSLIQKVRSYNGKGDTRIIREAYEFARTHHADQMRRSGEEFILHPLGVAHILADMQMDETTLAAALLHDVVEDTEISLDEVKRRFGPAVAEIIDGVTKLDRITFANREEAQAENFRKMFVAMARDIRVVIIKLADRLDNMKTIGHLSEDKQREKARETLEIYAPLAHRLGISQLKWQLEDLSFATLYPLRFQEIVQMVNQRRPEREDYIQQVKKDLQAQLKQSHIKAEIEGRVKHYYSIYSKMKEQGKQFDEIYDLFAVRVIVSSKEDCYTVMGIVHSLWHPVPGRIKDYVAKPRFGIYQSLHTTVIGPQGKPLEIQIRTQDMHRTAEYGIASHWRYKEAQRSQERIRERLAWIKRIVEWQRDLSDPQEFMESLKIDLFEEDVFVFTPKGDVIDLPQGSTPIDFAYAIHTEIGHRCVGAKVNDRLVPLEYKLRNGDIVSIITSKTSPGPSKDWMNIVQTARAKTKIRQWFSKERRIEDTQEGKEILVKQMRKSRLPIQKILGSDILEGIARDEYAFLSLDDLYASIGAGKTSAQQVVNHIVTHLGPEAEHAEEKPSPPRKRRRPLAYTKGVKVEGVDNVLVRIAHCCNPVPYDAIIGFVTRGRGVSVHRADCPNAAHMIEQDYRLIDVSWDTEQPTSFQVEICVEAMDRPRLLRDMTTIMGEYHVNILSATMNINRENVNMSRFVFELGNIAHLEDILRNIRKVDSVYNAYRVVPGRMT